MILLGPFQLQIFCDCMVTSICNLFFLFGNAAFFYGCMITSICNLFFFFFFLSGNAAFPGTLIGSSWAIRLQQRFGAFEVVLFWFVFKIVN